MYVCVRVRARVCVCVPDELDNGLMNFDNYFFYLLTMDPGEVGRS